MLNYKKGGSMNFKLSLILSLTLLLASCKNPPTKTDEVDYGFNPPPTWHSSMNNLKQNMLNLQPYIFNSNKFKDAKNYSFLQKNIHELAVEASNVKHSPMIKNLDPTTRFVAAQFSEELQRADTNFKEGWAEYSRSQLVKVTSYCLECHTRMNQGPSFKADQDNQVFVKTLPVINQIEFMIAFREFDAAFNLVLKDLKEIKPDIRIENKTDTIAKLGLQIAVQFMNDPARAHQITQAIDTNPSLPNYLKKPNQLWKKSIANWESNVGGRKLSDVRALVKNRISEIEDMRAIPILLNLLTENLNQNELGEVLLLTGQSYDELHPFSTLALHENYYESCIHKAPETSWAKICLSKYSDSIIMGYSGSSGTNIPKDVKGHLESLRNIIKSQNKK